LIVGEEERFGLADNLNSEAIVVDDLVHVEMQEGDGRVFFRGNTRQRSDETFFAVFELDDTGKIVVTATYREQNLDGSRCQRTISRSLTSIRKLYFPNRCAEGAYRPRFIILACGDGNLRLANVQWKNWNRAIATARATARANTCEPSCAGGHFVNYQVTVRAYRIRRCADTGEYQYTRLRISFVGSPRPRGSGRFVQPFNC
jgi:hypothetical protein